MWQTVCYKTLQVHHVVRVQFNTVEFFYNSNYKRPSEKVKTVTYGSVGNLNNVDMSDDETNDQQSPLSQDFEFIKVNIGDLVVVDYSSKKLKTFYLGVVQEISNNYFFVQYLRRTGKKTFAIKRSDTETIQLNEITKVITNEHFTINTRGQYITDELLSIM